MYSTVKNRFRRPVWALALLVLVLGLLAPSATTTATAAGGSISGVVLTSDGTTPIAGVTVGLLARVSDADGIRYQRVVGASATTGSNGAYNIPAAAGTYRVIADGAGVYATRFHPDAPFVDTATDIVVNETAVTTRNITMRRPGGITGSVVRALGGSPVAGATAILERQTGTAAAPGPWVPTDATTSTNASGVYQFSQVRPGAPYRVRISNPGFASLTAAVSGVSENQTTQAAQARLFSDDEGIIQGRVVNGSGQPVINVQVRARQRIATPEGTTLAVVADPVATGPDGRYAISLPEGFYRIEFSGPQIETVFYETFDGDDFNDEVFVPAGGTTSGINVEVFPRFDSDNFFPDNLIPPAVLGNVGYGRTLTASPGTWNAAAGTTFTYQWIRCLATASGPDTADCEGTPIPGATGPTYTIPGGPTPPANLEGARYRVEVAPEFFPFFTVTSAATSPSPGPGFLGLNHPQTAFENRARPVIQGTAEVGRTLTTSTGTWSSTPSSVSVQWFANGTPIPGATTTSYVVGGSTLGALISVRATATLGGSSASATSFTTDFVTLQTIQHLAAPRISGDPRVGETLSVSPGSWSETGLTFSYLWFADELAIPGATNQTFVPTQAQVGKRISALVQVTKANFSPAAALAARTSAVTPAGAGPDGTILMNVTPPSIVGTPAVGNTLNAVPGTWTPQPDSFTYQWLSNGTAIPGATNQTLVIPAAAQGTTITVRVTAVKATFPLVSATSAPTTAVAQGSIVNTVPPALGGSARVGGTLITSDGTWTPSGTLTYTYRWLADGVEIPGATTRTLVVPASASGKNVVAEVTASNAGFTSGTALSAPATINGATIVASGLPTIRGNARLGATLTAVLPPTTPSTGVTATYQWLRNGSTIAGATRSTYRTVAADLGNRLSVRVTFSAPGSTPSTRTSNATSAIKTVPLLTITPSTSNAGSVFRIRVQAPGTTPTGFVVIRKNGKVLARGKLTNGRVTLTVRGSRARTVQVAYLGDTKVLSATRSGVPVPRR